MNVARTLARRYAKAFVLTFKDEITPDVFACIQEVVAELKEHRTALFFLSLPSMRDAQKLKAMHQLCTKLTVSSACNRLMALLVRDKRAFLLLDVFSYVIEFYQEVHNIQTFTISSAQELTQEQLTAMQQFLAHTTGNDIIYKHTVTPALIAGIRAQSTTHVWEISVAKRLRSMRLALIK